LNELNTRLLKGYVLTYLLMFSRCIFCLEIRISWPHALHRVFIVGEGKSPRRRSLQLPIHCVITLNGRSTRHLYDTCQAKIIVDKLNRIDDIMAEWPSSIAGVWSLMTWRRAPQPRLRKSIIRHVGHGAASLPVNRLSAGQGDELTGRQSAVGRKGHRWLVSNVMRLCCSIASSLPSLTDLASIAGHQQLFFSLAALLLLPDTVNPSLRVWLVAWILLS